MDILLCKRSMRFHPLLLPLARHLCAVHKLHNLPWQPQNSSAWNLFLQNFNIWFLLVTWISGQGPFDSSPLTTIKPFPAPSVSIYTMHLLPLLSYYHLKLSWYWLFIWYHLSSIHGNMNSKSEGILSILVTIISPEKMACLIYWQHLVNMC